MSFISTQRLFASITSISKIDLLRYHAWVRISLLALFLHHTWCWHGGVAVCRPRHSRRQVFFGQGTGNGVIGGWSSATHQFIPHQRFEPCALIASKGRGSTFCSCNQVGITILQTNWLTTLPLICPIPCAPEMLCDGCIAQQGLTRQVQARQPSNYRHWRLRFSTLSFLLLPATRSLVKTGVKATEKLIR